MALPRALQSALSKFCSNSGILLIFQWALVFFVLLPALFFLGLIGVGCVVFWVIILAPFVIFSLPVLVPVGIFVGGVTSLTLAALGIVFWRWNDIVAVGQGAIKVFKRMYREVVRWLLTEINNMDATWETRPEVQANPGTPQAPSGTPSKDDDDDSTSSENSPEKSELNQAESSSSQTPEKSCTENSQTDDSFHSLESHAGDCAAEKSLLLKSFLCICAGIALAQCAVLVFFSFLARNMETYASSMLEVARR